jgi:hypothetical protein
MLHSFSLGDFGKVPLISIQSHYQRSHISDYLLLRDHSPILINLGLGDGKKKDKVSMGSDIQEVYGW